MILVTGGSGVLGRALQEELDRREEEYVTISSSELDLRDADATTARVKDISPRVIYHVAGRVHGLGGNSKYPAEMYTDNVRINTNIVDAACVANCEKIVAISTIATYSSDAPRPVKETSIWDGPPHASEAAYAHAKRGMLAQLEAYSAQHGLRFAYPIMTNIYGPHDRFDPVYGHVIPSLVAKFHKAKQTGEVVDIWGTGKAERDFIFSRDAARALVAIGESFEGPINVATGATVRIREVVDILQAHSGVSNVEWDANKPDGQLLRNYDVSRLAGIGFTPEVSLEQGLMETFDWYESAYPDVRS